MLVATVAVATVLYASKQKKNVESQKKRNWSIFHVSHCRTPQEEQEKKIAIVDRA